MTRITSTSTGSQPFLDRRVLIRVLLLGVIVLVATVGAGAGVVAADSDAVQQQSAPTTNSSNESLSETVVANSSNVSTVSATTTTTTNGSATTPAVANQSVANGTATLDTNTTTIGASTSNGSDANTTATTTTPVAVNESATATSESGSTSGLQFAFPNQTTNGTSVTVREPRLPEGGFLIVHDRSYPQNGLGSVIGVSEYIAPNTTYNRVQIRLFDVADRSFEQSRVRAPTTMYVQAVLDTNNNQQYDGLATTGAQDVSYLIDGNRPAVAGARIDVEQRLTTESQSGGLMDGFAPNQSQNQNQNQTPTTASSGAEPTTSEDGLRLNPNQGSGFSFGSIPRSIGDFGPLLVILAGLAVGLYIKNK